jgi:hypothetical protein
MGYYRNKLRSTGQCRCHMNTEPSPRGKSYGRLARTEGDELNAVHYVAPTRPNLPFLPILFTVNYPTE